MNSFLSVNMWYPVIQWEICLATRKKLSIRPRPAGFLGGGLFVRNILVYIAGLLQTKVDLCQNPIWSATGLYIAASLFLPQPL